MSKLLTKYYLVKTLEKKQYEKSASHYSHKRAPALILLCG